MISLLDTRGKPSRTLPFVAVSWLVVTVRFALGGLELGPLGTMPAMTAAEYGPAVSLILAIWIGREWKAKDLEKGVSHGNG
ncbi:hypothetical protein [Thioalkalivibrio sp. ALMg9]|uniref:hypothetical protein n=1 Tax=Thioalkalivibrio sp. ALMg9 TaxID=1266912 RepID=UPI00036D974C|nr:hypothetical protein [Thioalkalivibrio sp. ALMg9]